MTTIFVTYDGDADTRFDRGYYVHTHIPLVIEAWSASGLLSAAAFFPDGPGEGTIAVCVCQFRDDAAVDASFGSPEATRVMADIAHFTDVKPSQLRAAPFSWVDWRS